MTGSLLDDAFAHHVWATMRLIDACLPLSPDQLGSGVPGTYGSILETMRHLVGGDSDYLSIMTGDRAQLVDADEMDLPALRVAMENKAVLWSGLLARDLDPDAMVHSSTRTTGTSGTPPSASGSRRRCTTGPTIAARSAPLSRRSG